MAGFFLKPATQCHARSISLPTRLHPMTLKIEEELSKLRGFDVSSSSPKGDKFEAVIFGLGELYKGIEDLLGLEQTLRTLSHYKNFPLVEQLLEESVTFLDICNNMRENLMFLRASVVEIQSTLRRRNIREFDIENDANKFVSSLKKLRREIPRSLSSLKDIENKLETFIDLDYNQDEQFIAVVKVLKEASSISCSVFRALLEYLTLPSSRPWSGKWLTVSKLVLYKSLSSKKRNDTLNEIEHVNDVLQQLLVTCKFKGCDRIGDMLHIACKSLIAFEGSIEGIEHKLECLFRQLIQARVSLLNIVSH